MQRSYGGRNIIYCAVSFGEREYPACSLNFIFLPLFIQSWLTEHTCFCCCFFSANPCFTLIQSNVFVAGYKHSYTVCHQASRFSVNFIEVVKVSGCFLIFS